MAKYNPWLTGPAVEVLIKLGGLREGDHLKIKLCNKTGHQHPDDRRWVKQPYVVFTHGDNHHDWPLNITDRQRRGDFSWCPCGIVAWRRPDGKA